MDNSLAPEVPEAPPPLAPEVPEAPPCPLKVGHAESSLRRCCRLAAKRQLDLPQPDQVPAPSKKRISNAEAVKAYRKRMKAEEPAKYTAFMDANKDRCKRYRENLTNDKKIEQREKACLRMQKKRAKDKEQRGMESENRVTRNEQWEKARLHMQKKTAKDKEQRGMESENKVTRNDAARLETLRQQWRHEKKKRFDKLTDAERAKVNMKRREAYAAKKNAQKLDAVHKLTVTTRTASSIMELDSLSTPSKPVSVSDRRTLVAKRVALHRVKKAIPSSPVKYARTIEDLMSVRCALEVSGGHPAASWDKNHPDWIPTLNMGHDGSTKRSKKVPIRAVQTKSEEERLNPLPPSAMNVKLEIDIAEDAQPYRTAEHLLHIPDHTNVLLPSVHRDRTDLITANFPPRSRYLLQPSEVKTEVAEITEDSPVSFATQPYLHKNSTPSSGVPSATASENPSIESSLQSKGTNFVPVSFPVESQCLLQPSEIKTETDDISEDHPVSVTIERHQESMDPSATSVAGDSLTAACGVKYRLMNGISLEEFPSFDNELQGHSDFDNPSSAYRSDGPHETSSGEDEVGGHDEEGVQMDFKTALQYVFALKLFAFRYMPSLTDTFLAAENEIKAEFVKRQFQRKQASVEKLS